MLLLKKRNITISFIACIVVLLNACAYQPGVQRGYINSHRDAAPVSYQYKPSEKPAYSYTKSAGVSQYESLVFTLTKDFGIDPHLVLAFIATESSGRAWIVHPISGAVGLTQLLPSTARDYDPNVTIQELQDPRKNIEIAVQFLLDLKEQIKRHYPNLSIMEEVGVFAAAWHSGMTGARRFMNDSSNMPKTSRHIQKVRKFYKQYRWGNNSSDSITDDYSR